jgi:hypothetical protein
MAKITTKWWRVIGDWEELLRAAVIPIPIIIIITM